MTTTVNAIVLDSGALIAVERLDQRMQQVLKSAARDGANIIAPSTVVAQVWRGHRRQARLAQFLDSFTIAPFEPIAKRVGELLAASHTSDVCDAHVALAVSIYDADAVYTSDPRDIAHLLEAYGLPDRTIRC